MVGFALDQFWSIMQTSEALIPLDFIFKYIFQVGHVEECPLGTWMADATGKEATFPSASCML